MSFRSTRAAARKLVGKTVASIELNEFDSGRHGRFRLSTDPVITFTDGSVLCFAVEETEGEYGIGLVLSRRKNGKTSG